MGPEDVRVSWELCLLQTTDSPEVGWLVSPCSHLMRPQLSCANPTPGPGDLSGCMSPLRMPALEPQVPSTPSDGAPREGHVSLETLVSTRVPVSLQV